MSTTVTARPTVNPVGIAGFAALAIVLPHVPSFFHRLLDGDEAIYGSIAALMNMGGRLYAEGGVDNKPPGIFWVYAATFRVFGTYQMTAIHAVALLAVIATAFLIFLAGRQVGSTRAGTKRPGKPISSGWSRLPPSSPATTWWRSRQICARASRPSMKAAVSS